MAGRLGKQAGLNVDSVTNLGIYCALAAIAGREAHDVRGGSAVLHRSIRGEIFSLATLQAGGVFYGGLIAALAIAFWYMRKTKLPPLMTADVFAPASRWATASDGSAVFRRAAAGASSATCPGR